MQDHPDPAGNAYYPLIGLQLPGKGDPETKGREFVSKLSTMTLTKRIAYEQKPFESLVKLSDVPGCLPRKNSCLGVYQDNKGRIRAEIRKYWALLDAYSSTVTDYHAFYEAGQASGWYPGVFRVHKLYTLQTLDLWTAGHPQRALRKLSRDVRFWRMILGDAHLSITRTVAAAILAQDYGIAGEFLGACLACRDTTLAAKLFAPLTGRELDPTKAREGEFVRNVVLMKEADQETKNTGSIWRRTFYNRNRIINALYLELQDELRLANAAPERRAPLAKELEGKYAVGPSLVSWLDLYVHPNSKMPAAITWASRGNTYGGPARKLDRYRAQIAKSVRLEY
ncbi:MAG: hypothetical protein P8090_12490 [Gammaproteobacteria bacterium]